ncbi:MAG: hypothetical protein AB1508_15395 [Pseudomonadota bacterium]
MRPGHWLNICAARIGSSGHRGDRFREFGLSCAFALMIVSSPVFGQGTGSDYLPATAAPPSWAQFSKLVKYRFESWIAANDPVAKRFRGYLLNEAGPPQVIRVRAWINPDGTVERVSFPTLDNAQADADFETILKRGNVGEAPPPEMLQPLNLRFSLNLKR